MKKWLLTLGIPLVFMPAYADDLSSTTSKDGASDLAPARVTPRKPVAAPVEPAPQPAPAAAPLTPSTVTPQPAVKPVDITPAAAAPAPRAMPAAEPAPAKRSGDTGWFAGAGLGYSENRDYDCNNCGAAIGSLDDSGFAYKLFGGYRLHRNVALSAGYMDLADTKASGVGGAWNDKLEVEGFYAAVHGILPVTDKVDVFASVGILRWDQKVTFNGASRSFDGSDLMYGVGASYALNKTGAKVQLEWNRLNDIGTNDPNFGHIDDYDLVTVNLVFQF